MPETLSLHPIVHLDGYFDNAQGDFEVENRVLAAAGQTLCAPRQNVWEAAAEAKVVLFRAEIMDAEAIARLRNCRTLIRYGIGLDKVDIAEAIKRSIAVCNMPDFCTAEMADHTLALSLSLARRLPEYRILARQESVSLSGQYPVRDLSGMRFVTIGFGRIARQVLLRARAFGFQTAASDPLVDDHVIAAEGVLPLSREEALRTADILSLHCPLIPTTCHLLGKDSIALMKSEAVVINTARGGLIDTEALTAALASARLQGAGLDTTEPEPLPATHPLHFMDNVIITPHMAWYSEQAGIRLRQMVAEEALRAVQDEPLRYRVN